MSQRRAAILADMVGYSRLMGIDEAGTLARLRARVMEAGAREGASAGGLRLRPLRSPLREGRAPLRRFVR